MELDYRTQTVGHSAAMRFAIRYAIVASLGGLFAAIALRVMGALTTTPLFLAVATLFALIFGVAWYIGSVVPSLVVIVAVSGPLVWLLSVASKERTRRGLARRLV